MSMLSQKGFSLLEVLVALSIISVALFSINFATSSTRDQVDEVLDTVEQTLRYAQSEAILRNNMMRLRFQLDSTPQEYLLESGPTGDFVLPLFDENNMGGSLSLAQQEKRDKLVKELSSSFSRVGEFEKNAQFPDIVRIIGVGSSLLSGKMIQDGEFSIYSYSSGEKDGAILIFATTSEVVALTVEPFVGSFKRFYHAIEAKDEGTIIEEQERVAKEFYEKWRRGLH